MEARGNTDFSLRICEKLKKLMGILRALGRD